METLPDKKPAPIWPWILAAGVLLIGIAAASLAITSAHKEHRISNTPTGYTIHKDGSCDYQQRNTDPDC